MQKSIPLVALIMGAVQMTSCSQPSAALRNIAPFDPTKSLKDYAGETIIGSKASPDGRGDCVAEGEHADRNADLHLKNCTGLQPLLYPAFRGSWPNEKPEAISEMVFNTKGLDVQVNWGLANGQKTLHHLMIAPNQYFPKWFWDADYTAEELDKILKRYITTLMTANDNKTKLDGWNVSNEMFEHNRKKGRYKRDGKGRQDSVWMRMGFEEDQSGLTGDAKVNDRHPIVFRKALQYASIASGKLELRENEVAEVNRKSDAFYQLVKHLLNTGVRVDAVGFQGHLHTHRSYDWESVKANIRRFRDLGLEVYITELDVAVGGSWKPGKPFPDDYEKLQADRFYGLIKAAREAGAERIDVWGLCDGAKHHWLQGQRARLFDEQFQRRATYQAVLRALYDTQRH